MMIRYVLFYDTWLVRVLDASWVSVQDCVPTWQWWLLWAMGWIFSCSSCLFSTLSAPRIPQSLTRSMFKPAPSRYCKLPRIRWQQDQWKGLDCILWWSCGGFPEESTLNLPGHTNCWRSWVCRPLGHVHVGRCRHWRGKYYRFSQGGTLPATPKLLVPYTSSISTTPAP